MIESLRKQFFEGAGAKDMKLVTTRRAQKNAEDRHIITKTLYKKSSAGNPAELLLIIVCLFFA